MAVSDDPQENAGGGAEEDAVIESARVVTPINCHVSVLACCVHPLYFSLPWLSRSERKLVWKKLEMEVAVFTPFEGADTGDKRGDSSDSESVFSDEEEGDDAIQFRAWRLGIRGCVMLSQCCRGSIGLNVTMADLSNNRHIETMLRALRENSKSETGILDPIQFWKLKEKDNPIMAKVARMLLPIQATSAASERVFSTCGDLDRRARGRSNQLDDLVLIRRNAQLLGRTPRERIHEILSQMSNRGLAEIDNN